MASRKPPLEITLSPAARVELRRIYVYNAENRSPGQADRYEDYLLAGIGRLSSRYGDGKPVDDFPGVQAITLRRNSRGHGHVIVYRVDPAGQVIRILHIYHTRQDIPGRMRREGAE